MKLTFCLRSRKTTKPTPIHCFIHFNQQQLKIATGCSIAPRNWNQAKRRVKQGAAEQATINTVLAKMEADFVEIFARLQVTGVEPTLEIVKERYAELLGRPVSVQETPDVMTAYETFIKDAESRLQPASIKVHRTAQRHLKDFAKTNARSFTLDWERLDGLMFEKFAKYLTTQAKLNNTSLWKNLSTVRTFMQWANEQGYTQNTDYQKFTRRKLPKGEKSPPVYLTQKEIETLINLDLSKNDKLARVRDVFIFQLHTGMRYSDIQALRPEHVHDDMISLVTQKNRRAVVIPLLPVARTIWERYDGVLPVISNQKANKYLKELMGEAKLDTPQIVVDYQGPKRIERTVAKSDLIGTHSAKRTFVTILRQQRVSIEAICKITGNSRRTIETYIVGTATDAMDEVRAALSSTGNN